MMTTITTAAEAIDALGGTAAVARLIGSSYMAVYQWRRRGLPRNTYIALERALTDKGFTCSPGLWQQRSLAS